MVPEHETAGFPNTRIGGHLTHPSSNCFSCDAAEGDQEGSSSKGPPLSVPSPNVAHGPACQARTTRLLRCRATRTTRDGYANPYMALIAACMDPSRYSYAVAFIFISFYLLTPSTESTPTFTPTDHDNTVPTLPNSPSSTHIVLLGSTL
jgi:hypothetical protein